MTSYSKWLSELLKDESKGDDNDMARRGKARMNEDDDNLLLSEGGTLLEEVQRYLSVGKIKRMFSLGSELFSAASPFLEKPTWWTAGQSAFAMGKVMVEDVEVWADDYFGGDEWTEPYNADFNQTVLNVLQKYPYERIKTAEENTYVRLCTLPNGVKCGWSYSSRLNQVEHIYIDTDRLREGRDFIKKALWEQYKGKSLVMRKNTRLVMSGDSDRVIFEVDDVFETKLSKRAIDYAEYLKRPLSEGVPRSVLFYGPPGTGKSTLARTLVERMGLRSFRIRIGDLGNLDNSTLFDAISIFEPDAVILDDFDRAHGQATLLETLEFFQQKVKLVIVTVNNRKALDGALMRPGRLDELILIDKMEEDVVKHVLGEYVDGYELVKDWPISFIGEYVKRRKYMNTEEAAESVKELTIRVNELSNYGDDKNGDMKTMLKLLKVIKDDSTDDSTDNGDDSDTGTDEALAEGS